MFKLRRHFATPIFWVKPMVETQFWLNLMVQAQIPQGMESFTRCKPLGKAAGTDSDLLGATFHSPLGKSRGLGHSKLLHSFRSQECGWKGVVNCSLGFLLDHATVCPPPSTYTLLTCTNTLRHKFLFSYVKCVCVCVWACCISVNMLPLASLIVTPDRNSKPKHTIAPVCTTTSVSV